MSPLNFLAHVALSRENSTDSLTGSVPNHAVLNKEIEVNYLANNFQNVHYSKPASTTMINNSVNNSALVSTSTIVDVTPDTQVVTANIESCSFPVLSFNSFPKNPIVKSFANVSLHSTYVPALSLRSSERKEASSASDFNCNLNKVTQTERITLDSISDILISLLLSVSVQVAFLCILKIIRARFPHAFILKVLPDFCRVLITGAHPRCWTPETLLASLRVKIRSGNKLYDHMRKILFSIPICFFSK